MPQTPATAEAARTLARLDRELDQALAGGPRRRPRLRAALTLALMSAGAIALLYVADGLSRFLGVHP